MKNVNCVEKRQSLNKLNVEIILLDVNAVHITVLVKLMGGAGFVIE